MRKPNAPMWMITPVISEFTLEDYVDKHKSEITFHQALLLTRQLLEIVQRCHKLRVLHRNLQPSNILVNQNNDPVSTDEIVKLVLIGFGVTWIDNQELSITDENDFKMIDQVIKKHSNQPLQHLLSPTLRSQCRSPTIDATSVCHILFWLLTDHWLEQMYYTDTHPHYDYEYQQKINEKLGRVISVLNRCLKIPTCICSRRRSNQYKIM
jgi:serine/threonine protein kinase